MPEVNKIQKRPATITNLTCNCPSCPYSKWIHESVGTISNSGFCDDTCTCMDCGNKPLMGGNNNFKQENCESSNATVLRRRRKQLDSDRFMTHSENCECCGSGVGCQCGRNCCC